MFNLKRSLFFVGVALFSVASNAVGTVNKTAAPIIVTDGPSYAEAVIQACEGAAINAGCTINFSGGSVSFGICVPVPGSVGGTLTCQINPDSIPSCKNSATTLPGSAMLFALAALSMYFIRRKHLA